MICSIVVEEGCVLVIRQLNELQLWLVSETSENIKLAEFSKHDSMLVDTAPRLQGLSQLSNGSCVLFLVVGGELAFVELNREEERVVFGKLRSTGIAASGLTVIEVVPKGGVCYIAEETGLELYRFHPCIEDSNITRLVRTKITWQAKLPSENWRITQVTVAQYTTSRYAQLTITLRGKD